jgi:hypothetical protein
MQVSELILQLSVFEVKMLFQGYIRLRLPIPIFLEFQELVKSSLFMFFLYKNGILYGMYNKLLKGE